MSPHLHATRKELVESDVEVPIPIVDIGNLFNLTKTEFDLKSPKIKEIADNMSNALHNHGFVYLANHGIPEDVVSHSFEESAKFFALPSELKMKCAKITGEADASINFHGYAAPGLETLEMEGEEVKEWKEMFDFFTMGMRKLPTEDAPAFAPTLQKLENSLRHLETKLLRLLAIAIGLEDVDYFYDRCQNLEHPDKYTSGSLLRATIYPPIPEDLKKTGTWIGCNEHTDWGVFTLLFQDSVGGLEVQTAQGEWIKATPIPNTIVCNTGGLLEKWTGGYFPATPHRVHVKPVKRSELEEPSDIKNARQSLIFFTQPDDEVLIETVETDIIPKGNKMKPILAGDYFRYKALLAYGQELDVEI